MEAVLIMEQVEDIERSLLPWKSRIEGAMRVWLEHTSGDDLPMHRSYAVMGGIRSELHRRKLFGSLHRNERFPNLSCLL